MIGGLAHTCTLQKRNRKKKFTYTNGAGTPTAGQTVTGGTSGATAVIDKVATGYIVVKTLVGAFTTNETITTTTFSGKLSAQADYLNQSGEYEYYWSNDQLLVPCRFYYSVLGGRGEVVHETGQLIDQPLKCALPLHARSTLLSTGLSVRLSGLLAPMTSLPYILVPGCR